MSDPPYADQRGVSLDLLCCPTCGERFGHVVSRDEPLQPLPYMTVAAAPIIDVASPAYLLCRRGHAWTVKMVLRREGVSDEVLLGTYLGEL